MAQVAALAAALALAGELGYAGNLECVENGNGTESSRPKSRGQVGKFAAAAVAACVVLTGCSSPANKAQGKPGDINYQKVGGQPTAWTPVEKGPDFTVANLKGLSRLGETKVVRDERPILLNFWASWCGPCKEEMPMLQRLSRAFATKVQVIGVSRDAITANARNGMKEFGVTYANVHDPDNKFAQSLAPYTSGGLPISLLVKDGRVQQLNLGAFVSWKHLTGPFEAPAR